MCSPDLPAGPGSASPQALEAVHAPILKLYPELVADLGGDPDSLSAEVGIAPLGTTPGDARPSYRQIADLLELTAARLGCPDFGMRLASRQCRAPVQGPLGDAVAHARRFGDALELIRRHSYAHSLAAGIWLKPVRQGEAILLGQDILLDQLAVRRQMTEHLLLTSHLWAIRLTRGLARARRVYFRHEAASPLRSYRDFGCDVRFGQPVNGLLFSSRDLTRPITAADDLALQSALAAIEARFLQRRPPLVALVRGVVMHRLGLDRCTIESVACALGLHPRTLHRRLRAENSSFRQIRDAVRREMLGYYLRATDLEVGDISERLGFAEQSVLTRFCRRWFSQSPTELRAPAAGGARRGDPGAVRLDQADIR